MQKQGFVATLWRDSVSRWVAVFAAVIITIGIIVYWSLGPLKFDQGAKIFEIVITSIGLLSLVLLLAQNRATLVWNRLFSYHEYFQNLPPEHLVKALQDVAVKHKFLECVTKVKELPDSVINDIYTDRDALFMVSSYLDSFEMLCGAINARIVNPDYAYHLEGMRIIRAYVVFDPLVRKLRLENKYSRCYLELQRLGSEWKMRREQEEARNNIHQGMPSSTP